MSPTIAIRDIRTGGWVRSSKPIATIRADRLDDVRSALQELDQQVARDRLYAVGFITYEASPAFDSALSAVSGETQTSPQLPYVYFGLFDRLEPFQFPTRAATTYELSPWQADISAEQFGSSITRIKQYIKQGDTYQVNFTFRQRSQFEGDPWPLFVKLVNAQDTPYCAYIDTDEFAVCSASPELFFKQVGNEIELRPMKGTVARGRTLAEDADNQLWLQQSSKDRAENLMIVDMIRNDVSHIASLGSVRVPSLFDIERYPSIHQMTSTVRASARASLWETLQALFPCASITGAPKVRTMAIIRELETSPRNLYTGSIGLIDPDGSMQFNVAIRTVSIDKRTGNAEYGVGSGIVWDSESDREFAECLEKTKVLTHRLPEFDLLESLLWTPDDGYSLLSEHLERLQQSARYFDIPLTLEAVRERLQQAALPLEVPSKVRLTVSRAGDIGITTQELGAPVRSPVSLAITADPISSSEVFLFHKTTHRAIYERHRAAFPDAHDVVLWNEHGQVTEGCWGNIAAWIDGVWVTPPIRCGVLAGVYRRQLLEQGRLQERAISMAELVQCDRLAWFNSVRGWHDAVVLSDEGMAEDSLPSA
ncbi:MAG: aminodeoxychorismate synthase component I [Cyanobacteria bacterium J06597_1]